MLHCHQQLLGAEACSLACDSTLGYGTTCHAHAQLPVNLLRLRPFSLLSTSLPAPFACMTISKSTDKGASMQGVILPHGDAGSGHARAPQEGADPALL